MSKVAYRYLQGVKRIVYSDPTKSSNQTDPTLKQSASTINSEQKTDQQDQSDQTSQEYDAMSLFNTMTNNSSDTTNIENNPLDEFGFESSMYNNTSEEPIDTENFEENLYKSEQDQQNQQHNIDEFIQYSIDFHNKVSAKEARTSIESRLPFIVDKADFKSFTDQRTSKKNKKSAVIRETDSIYKPVVKMRKSGEQNEFNITSSERVGFITVQSTPQLDKNFNTKQSQQRPKSITKKLDRIAGILNEKFIITKRKPFNTKKIGYLPVNLSEIQPLDYIDIEVTEQVEATGQALNKNQTAYYDRLCIQKKLLEHEQERNQTEPIQRYVEIVESRGIGRFVYLAAIIIVLWFVLNTFKNSDLGKNWSLDGLNLIRTQEQTIETETNIELTMNATPTLEENKLNLNLTSQSVENISFTVEIIDNETGERVYSTEEQLPSGSSIDTIEINSSLYNNNTEESLYRTATVRCKTYKGDNNSGKYIGEVEQAIEIKIKPTSEG